MAHASAEVFIQALLETLDGLPPKLAKRLEEVLKQPQGDRAQAIRQLFEEFAGEPNGEADRE